MFWNLQQLHIVPLGHLRVQIGMHAAPHSDGPGIGLLTRKPAALAAMAILAFQRVAAGVDVADRAW